MMNKKRIKRALISVYKKDNIDSIIKKLHAESVELISTSGTAQFIEDLGIPCRKVEDLTGYPSIFGGRVKTLHPAIMGGILARRELSEDSSQMSDFNIDAIDLVIVDLYPFDQAVKSQVSEEEIIEKIDIGGISLIRAAAKNYKDVLVVASQELYAPLFQLLEENGAASAEEERRWFAKEAFAVSSWYDSLIFNYLDNDNCTALRISENGVKLLRYGENPHQKGVFFGNFESMFEQLQGKEISYNNLLDIDAAVALINDFEDITFAILKHNNACGLACRNTIFDAWCDALGGDPVSAFGGIIVTNAIIDKKTAEEINKIFFEVIIAPDYNLEAFEILSVKKNRIILILKDNKLRTKQLRSLLNGFLLQDRDTKTENADDLKVVTENAPTANEIDDLIFANKIVKHSKSNAIVIAKSKQLIGSGVGQMSRVDALEQAIAKAKRFGFDLNGAVIASDAFFPFSDCVEIASNEGITAIVQPGGSVNDQKSIDLCNQKQIAMTMTGIRHFKH
ncbi:MAG: bifunctional phosphoribosylaminoimidazolecarboxamide formyltransferase/IMP cyclohydrolase [Paludibacter sp.]|nr:bifunctional phosphoribosylaminoimidazolecarboxamide formyltransferase/IMP cyclohydrolase [Paludibacter sp.]